MKAILWTGVSASAGVVARIVAAAAVWAVYPCPGEGAAAAGRLRGMARVTAVEAVCTPSRV